SWALHYGTLDATTKTYTLDGINSLSLWTLAADTVVYDNILVTNPEPMYAFMEYPYGDMTAMFYLGGEFAGGGHTVDEISEPTIMVNGLTPISTAILEGYSGFAGQVMAIEIDISDFIGGYPLLWDITSQSYSVTGDLTAGGSFIENSEIAMIGHTSGDANFDGIINILDVTRIIGYIYKGGEEPRPIIETGDANGDGSINILDATRLIAFLYKDGAAPTHP
ncbi:MAG: dockerin type I repeat-containing protein, partial [Candidatus Zixiibacteriota bacterium]